jgi:transposase
MQRVERELQTTMIVPNFLPCTAELALDDIFYRENGSIVIAAHACAPIAICPSCSQPSKRMHSRYVRRVADLPIQGKAVQLAMDVRRFQCRTPSCPQRIFTERLPQTVSPYARETQRHAATVETLAFALGGKPTQRVAEAIGMPIDDAGVIRRLRRATVDTPSTVTVVGIDDFAFKKNERYGSILVDLQERRPLDLLPDRTKETVEEWMREHPEIEVVSRDRSSAYRAAIDAGAPQAVQVADRFHLVQNAVEAVQHVVEREHNALTDAAKKSATTLPSTEEVPAKVVRESVATTSSTSPAKQALSVSRRERRYKRYCEMMRLRENGMSLRDIARTLHLARGTIRRWLRAGSFPERAHRNRKPMRSRSITPYTAFLEQRMSEGMRNLKRLHQEIRERGFRGSYRSVLRWAAERKITEERAVNTPIPPKSWLAPRAATWLLMRSREELSSEDQRFVHALLEQSPAIADATNIAEAFVRLIREHDASQFDAWIEKARESELKRFAMGIEEEHDSVKAALELPWSNGPVEGHVHRLKSIKRQMYGRANFDLLRIRVLHRAA